MDTSFVSDHPHRKRHLRTVEFLTTSLPVTSRVLDLGEDNALAQLMRSRGYSVSNTVGDLDLQPEVAATEGTDAVTAFEILEHLVSPFPVLRAITAERLFASVPLDLWFAKAYRNPADPWDRHFHEFEQWQFDWLLEKSGWEIVRFERWTSPSSQIGLRPLLRRFVPRHYIVEARRLDLP